MVANVDEKMVGKMMSTGCYGLIRMGKNIINSLEDRIFIERCFSHSTYETGRFAPWQWVS